MVDVFLCFSDRRFVAQLHLPKQSVVMALLSVATQSERGLGLDLVRHRSTPDYQHVTGAIPEEMFQPGKICLLPQGTRYGTPKYIYILVHRFFQQITDLPYKHTKLLLDS